MFDDFAGWLTRLWRANSPNSVAAAFSSPLPAPLAGHHVPMVAGERPGVGQFRWLPALGLDTAAQCPIKGIQPR